MANTHKLQNERKLIKRTRRRRFRHTEQKKLHEMLTQDPTNIKEIAEDLDNIN